MKIKDYCRAHNITAYSLSKKTNLSTSYCYKLFAGKIKTPSLSNMRKIADAIGVNIEYLFD